MITIFLIVLNEFTRGKNIIEYYLEDLNGKIQIYTIIYYQYDGYLEKVGIDLVNFVDSKKIVTGYTNPCTQFNGFGCMIAQYIARFKQGTGNMYICSPDQQYVEEYNYTVTFINNDLVLFSVNGSKDMTIEQFKKYCKNPENSDDDF